MCKDCLYFDKIEDKNLPYKGVCQYFIDSLNTSHFPFWFDNKLKKEDEEKKCSVWANKKRSF